MFCTSQQWNDDLFKEISLNVVFCIGFIEIPQEVAPEDWQELKLSTVELSIATQNRQLDLTVRPSYFIGFQMPPAHTVLFYC